MVIVVVIVLVSVEDVQYHVLLFAKTSVITFALEVVLVDALHHVWAPVLADVLEVAVEIAKEIAWVLAEDNVAMGALAVVLVVTCL